ncbi:MAG: SpoIIE family protein phosphatase [Bacteroidales bacterium]|jgi:serine phosphatase RsbU (regulator of sigma subunit)
MKIIFPDLAFRDLFANHLLSAGQIASMTPGLFHLLLYSVIIISVTWLLIRSQAHLLLKTILQLRQKEKALQDIESEREQLEIKNKSITESLVYAQRIQEALLPSEDNMQKYVRQSFILYKPRDIVSGDFYWTGEKGDKRFIAAADCTGHGVPGALMSMIGHDLLEKIINTDEQDHPGRILDSMNKALADTFRGARSVGTIIRDGMDIGICAIDIKKKKIEYAGAFFPLYLIRENRLIETKGDKYVLGTVSEGSNYSTTEIDLQPDDILYLFSDGYMDQFGGDENKKFMYRRFRYLLMTIHRFPLQDQKSILEENIRKWQGTNPQVDDILVIGFKPI